ncbi:MAG: peptide-methionine (S)-S-oxide reductase MsrA [Synechococcus sp. LacPavin_0920_WC12_MAG_50_7]|nr:peptide-methionine (S)-S-oxide reductase MsrA [Synechococcus sp. LacPavin_0920_WC12_MAG_50_7]
MADSNKHFVLGSSIDAPVAPNQAEAIFGCGCFWGAEKGFWRLPGVVSTAVGYAGGSAPSPSYNAVCGGHTGHAEVVRVVWNPEIIDFSDLLKLFWECHDPTQGDRQGNDRGSQYRSVIYTHSEELDGLAKAGKNSYQALLSEKGFPAITTEIKLDQVFYAAEPEHQQYLAKPGSRPYCSAQPTKIKLGPFAGCHYLLPEIVWSNYDWSVNHCVLRGDNSPITV